MSFAHFTNPARAGMAGAIGGEPPTAPESARPAAAG